MSARSNSKNGHDTHITSRTIWLTCSDEIWHDNPSGGGQVLRSTTTPPKWDGNNWEHAAYANNSWCRTTKFGTLTNLGWGRNVLAGLLPQPLRRLWWDCKDIVKGMRPPICSSTLRSLSLSLSLCFNSHFPGEPGLASVYWSKGCWRWWWQLDYWSYKSCKAPAKSPPPTNQHPVFTGRTPLLSPNQQCQSTEGKNITSHGLAYPKLTWGLPTLSLTTKSSWLPWGRVAMPLTSPLMPVPQPSDVNTPLLLL